MKLLIVDDSHTKVELVAKAISEARLNVHITHETNVMSARKRLKEDDYDLLLIDIQLPDMPGGSLNIKGGLDLFDLIIQDTTTRIPAEILFVTSEDSLIDNVRFQAERRGSSLCVISHSRDGWTETIKGQLNLAARRASKKIECYDISIVTALGSELDAVLSLDYNWENFRLAGDPTLYHKGKLEFNGIECTVVAASALRKGMAASAALATKILLKFKPKLLAMTGICAGVKGKTGLGDVIVGNPTWDWGSGKHAENKDGSPVFKLSPKQSELNFGLSMLCEELNRSEKFKSRVRANWRDDVPGGNFQCHIGPMASGASVIANSSIATEIINQNRDVIGIEMEAFAVMVAAEYATVDNLIAVAIKSVCDFADNEKHDDWQKYAAYTSALYADELFKLHFTNA